MIGRSIPSFFFNAMCKNSFIPITSRQAPRFVRRFGENIVPHGADIEVAAEGHASQDRLSEVR